MARDYGTVSSGIWTGKTGKALRGNQEAQIMALYLMTCSHAQMTGIYYLPMMYAGYETGLGVEGASKGLRSLLEGGFCAYDEDTEYVFVFNLAREQVGCELKGSDNRVKGIKKQLASCPQKAFVARFYELYGDAYEISPDPTDQAKKSKPLRSPLEAPSKPGTGTGTEKEEKISSPSAHPQSAKRGSRLADDWQPSASLIAWAKTERPDIDPTKQAEAFRDYWHAKPGKDGRKLNWDLTFKNWIRQANSRRASPARPEPQELKLL